LAIQQALGPHPLTSASAPYDGFDSAIIDS
jgi:hypothetical protein